MHKLLLVALVIGSSFSCAAMRSGLANASAQHIRGCRAQELEVSNTSGANPFSGPSWTAICHGETYQCTGYMQVASTVKCHRVN